jgi:hypothetical protein
MVYAGLHPVRLIVQAHNVGLAPKTFRASYVPTLPNGYETPAPGTDVDASGDGFPYDAPLPDGRRHIALVFPTLPREDNDWSRPARPDTRHGKLYLRSDDAAGKPCIAAFPEGMDSLVGITDDHRILAARLRSLPQKNEDIRFLSPRTVDLTRVGVLDNPAPPEHFQALAPRVGFVEEIAISPTGNRILWSISFLRHTNPIVAWAARYWKYLDRYATTRDAIGVYVTGLHGEDPVRIGEETAEPLRSSTANSKSALTPLPAHLRWEPDGKGIRFACGENDYTMALDGR